MQKNTSELITWSELNKLKKTITNKRFPLCEDKKQFHTGNQAINAEREYRERILQSTIATYWCTEHHTYHLGHQRFMDIGEVTRRDQLIFVNSTGKQDNAIIGLAS